MELNMLDVFFIVVIGLSVLFGVIKGLVRELFALGFLIVGITLAFMFDGQLALLLGRWIKSRDLAGFVSFVVILLTVLGIGVGVTYLVKKIFIIGPLKTLDRLLGGAFGFLRGWLLCAILVLTMMFFSLGGQWRSHSLLAPWMVKSLRLVISILPEKLQQKMDLFNHDNQKTERDRRTI